MRANLFALAFVGGGIESPAVFTFLRTWRGGRWATSGKIRPWWRAGEVHHNAAIIAATAHRQHIISSTKSGRTHQPLGNLPLFIAASWRNPYATDDIPAVAIILNQPGIVQVSEHPRYNGVGSVEPSGHHSIGRIATIMGRFIFANLTVKLRPVVFSVFCHHKYMIAPLF